MEGLRSEGRVLEGQRQLAREEARREGLERRAAEERARAQESDVAEFDRELRAFKETNKVVEQELLMRVQELSEKLRAALMEKEALALVQRDEAKRLNEI